MDAGSILFDKKGVYRLVHSMYILHTPKLTALLYLIDITTVRGDMILFLCTFLCTCWCVQVSLEITCEEGSLLTYFGGSVEGVSVRLKQSRAGLQLHLQAAGATLVDSSIDDKGHFI